MIVPLEGLPGWRHLAMETVGSTNTEALQLGQGGDSGNLWVTGTRQLAGKARRGRSWVSEPGNLYASLLLVVAGPSSDYVTLPLIASLALHKALTAVQPELSTRLKIKWPNDVLLDGKKLSGILLEAASSTAGNKSLIVIGFGVNCKHYPDNPLYPATSLEAAGIPVPPDTLFHALATSLAKELAIWNSGAGFLDTRKDWLDRAAGVGEKVTARFTDYEVEGRFVDIDADGFLLLKDQEQKIQRISAADIFFGVSHGKGA